MQKKPQKSDTTAASKKEQLRLKKNTKQKQVRGHTKLPSYPSSSEINSEQRSKNHQKLQEVNSDDQELINSAEGYKVSIFKEQILDRFELQKIDQIYLSKDQKILYLVTLLGKKDPTSECKCVCTSRDMVRMEERGKRCYRREYLKQYLLQNQE